MTISKLKTMLRTRRMFDKAMLKFEVAQGLYNDLVAIPKGRDATIRTCIDNYNHQVFERLNITKVQLDKENELYVQIDKAISKLPGDERLLVMLHYIEGKTWEETADAMFYSESGIRKKGDTILKKLLKLI